MLAKVVQMLTETFSGVVRAFLVYDPRQFLYCSMSFERPLNNRITTVQVDDPHGFLTGSARCYLVANSGVILTLRSRYVSRLFAFSAMKKA